MKKNMDCKMCKFIENEEYSYRRLKSYKYWYLYLSDSHQCLGWSNAILKRHIENFEELKDEELIELKKVVKEWKDAMTKFSKPNWFNVMHLGNGRKHLHFQLVPRYEKKRVYSDRTFIDRDYGRMVVERIKKEKAAFLGQLAKEIKEKIN
jgi:diadenosine tetraphosphate (Ap4A) HIT family hydrolase